MWSDAGTLGSPGIVMMSPVTITTKPAPAARRTSRMLTVCPVGAPRRDWKNSLIGDGFIIVRHPEWGGVWRLMEQCIGNIHLIAG